MRSNNRVLWCFLLCLLKGVGAKLLVLVIGNDGKEEEDGNESICMDEIEENEIVYIVDIEILQS